MNIYRLAGDLCHSFGIAYLLFSIVRGKTCIGISGKSQLLFFLVFATRYLDLLLYYVSFYNTLMKLQFIALTAMTVYCVHIQYKKTYEWKKDTFLTEILIASSMILALYVNHNKDPTEILWTFSIYLEPLAIVPQFYMIVKTKKIYKHTRIYLTGLGLYRTLYLVNWAYRYFHQGTFDLIAISAGAAYALIYLFWLVAMLCCRVKMADGSGNLLHQNISLVGSPMMPIGQSEGHREKLTGGENSLVKTENGK